MDRVAVKRFGLLVFLSAALGACSSGHHQPSGYLNVGGIEVPADQVPVTDGGTAISVTYSVTQPSTGCGIDGTLQCHQTAQISYTDENGVTQQVNAETPWSLSLNMPPGSLASLDVTNYFDSDTSTMICAIESGVGTIAGPTSEYGGSTATCSATLP